MKKTGIVRKLDDLGRITLPIELRRILHLAERDSIEISTDDDKIDNKHLLYLTCFSVNALYQDTEPFKI